MLLPLHAKIGLFLLLWFEIGRGFALDADAAFLVAICVAYGTVIVRATGFELIGLGEELTALFVAWGIIWLYLFTWLAPAFLREMYFSLLMCAVIALVLLGTRSFDVFLRRRELFTKGWLRARSEAVVGCMLTGLGSAMLAERRWGSVLPLIGYGALFVLPFAFGWRIAARTPRHPFDAAFGERGRFRDAGVSEDQ